MVGCLSLMGTACDDDNKFEDEVTEPQPVWVDGEVQVLTTTANRSKDLAPSALSFSSKDNMSRPAGDLPGNRRLRRGHHRLHGL